MAISYQKLPDGAAVRAAAQHSYFVTCFTADDAVGYAVDGAVAWRRTFNGTDMMLADGEPAAAAALIKAIAEDAPPERVSLPREVMLRLPETLRPPDMGEWRWFYTDEVPAVVPGEERVEWLPMDEAGLAAIETLLDEAFPDASARTDSAQSKGWFGVRDENGKPIACGLVSGPAADVPFLVSVAVHPSARRQGLASAMTAWVTRTLMADGHAFVALGSMEGEDATHRIYRRIGYRDTHALMSGYLATVAA